LLVEGRHPHQRGTLLAAQPPQFWQLDRQPGRGQVGDPGVRMVWDRFKGSPAEETRYFDWIYQRMHSLKSIQMLGA
jgi:hypothetical protein